MRAIFGNSEMMFSVAQEAYIRLEALDGELEGGRNDALVCVLFSAATLEATIFELEALAGMGAQAYSDQAYLVTLHELLSEAERSRGSIELKYQLARTAIAGKAYERGAQPFQDFALLFKLRNEIVHQRPEAFTSHGTNAPSCVKALEALGICEPQEPKTITPWLYRISTRAVAKWSMGVVVTMVKSLREQLPKDATKVAMEHHVFWWGKGFEKHS